jgi:hypothetical protein
MEEEVPAGGFLGYLMNKYVPSSRLKKTKAKTDDDGESPALDLNDDEQEYYRGSAQVQADASSTSR